MFWLFLSAVVLCIDRTGGSIPAERYYSLAIDAKSILTAIQLYGPSSVSTECQADLGLFADGVINGTDWAWSMADGWGFPESGYFQGNGVWEGSYASCQGVASLSPEGGMEGQLCMTNWYYAITGMNVGLATCLPRSCNMTDVVTFLAYGAGAGQLQLPAGFPTNDEEYSTMRAYCTSSRENRDMTGDASAMSAIAILSFFGLLVVVATTYDVVTTLRKPSQKEKTNLTSMAKQQVSTPKSIHNGESKGEQGVDNPAYEVINDVTPPAGNGVVPSQKPDKPAPVMKAKKTNTFVRLLCAFSFYHHVPRLLSFEHSRGSFQSLNGIRFLTFAWIVLGHTFQLGITFTVSPTIDNTVYQTEIGQRVSGQLIDNMYVAVEAFFVLSAFLTTVSFLKKMSSLKKPTCRMMSMFYFHRFWRLTPVYMMVVMFYGCLFPYLGTGPLYNPSIPDADDCRISWWKNLLYVNNVVTANQCMGWSWYLANDFQFYAISPAFLLALYYQPKLGITLTILAIVVSLAARASLYSVLYLNGYDGGWYFQWIYYAPWCRWSTYFMGMLLGYMMWRRGFKRVQMNKFVAIGLWVVMLGVSTTMVLITPVEKCTACQIIYGTLLSPIFGIFVVWVIFACLTGNAGFINIILSWNGWLPLARLSYVGYLLHPILIYFTYYSNKVQLYMTNWTMMYMYMGHLLLTLGISFIVSLCLEIPFGAIEGVIFGAPKPKAKIIAQAPEQRVEASTAL